MATNIPTGFGNVATLSRKAQLAQVSMITSNGKPMLDTTGIAADQERRDVARSARQQLRRLVDKDGDEVYLRTHLAYILQALKVAAPTTAEDFINTVNDALASAAAATEVAPPAEISSISEKKLWSGLTFLNGSGQLAIDDVGGDFTSVCFRPSQVRSARHQARRLMALNSDSLTLRLATASGIITRKVAADAGATVAAIMTSINAAITASTSATAITAEPAKAPSTSLLNQIQSLLVVAGDGTIAIDDTGETTLDRANLKRSQQSELKRLIEGNDDTNTFRIQTTAGIKWKKVSALDAGTAAAADILAALTDAA